MGKNDEPVNILYACNDGYVPYLSASLCSLFENNRAVSLLSVYILSVKIAKKNKQILKALAHRYGRKLSILELGDIRPYFPYAVDTRGFDISAMARLFAPRLLPEGVERILYLDCDTLVLSELNDLFWTPLMGRAAGMVMEPTIYAGVKAAIGLSAGEGYFNSGVILMDLALWRREGILESLLDFYGNRGAALFACDQDTLNGALRGRILALKPKYNFFSNYRYFRYKTLTTLCSAYKVYTEKDFARAKRAPVILHFAGDERPWIKGNHNHYRRLFRQYLAKTPFKGTPEKKGQWLYMQLWWVLNGMTFICPAFRLFLSKRLGMRLVDARAKKGGNRK